MDSKLVYGSSLHSPYKSHGIPTLESFLALCWELASAVKGVQEWGHTGGKFCHEKPDLLSLRVEEREKWRVICKELCWPELS